MRNGFVRSWGFGGRLSQGLLIIIRGTDFCPSGIIGSGFW
jgi:hypothetical protein